MTTAGLEPATFWCRLAIEAKRATIALGSHNICGEEHIHETIQLAEVEPIFMISSRHFDDLYDYFLSLQPPQPPLSSCRLIGLCLNPTVHQFLSKMK
jgi:hypothetical protein